MNVNGKSYKTIWFNDDILYLINQNKLPYEFEILKSKSYHEVCHFIKDMNVRGAGAIGATAGFAMALAAIEAPKANYDTFIGKAKLEIENTRPTARNLFYATNRVYTAAKISVEAAIKEAQSIAQEDTESCKKIGFYGNQLIQDGWTIETHCNAGWLAFTDYGSALAPIYVAHNEGKEINVLVDETRPRNQGARLTAWELQNEKIKYDIIPDNAGAFMMSRGKVNIMIVGADRIARNGDTANKIGTLEKAIIAKEYNIPFYIAAPLSTFDISINSGIDIPIEFRDQNEVLQTEGIDLNNKIRTVSCSMPNSTAINPAFDVTPAKYITGFITEKGIFKPTELEELYGNI